MATTDLVTLQEVKDYLGITVNDHDTKLQDLIAECTDQIERYTGKLGVQRSVTEKFRLYDHKYDDYDDGYSTVYHVYGRRSAKRIYLETARPVQSVSSIQDGDGNTVDAADYKILPDLDAIEHINNFVQPVDSNGAVDFWTVTYTGGLAADTANVPKRWKLACKLLVSMNFCETDPMVVSRDFQDISVKRDNSGMPLRVKSLLESDMAVSV